MKGEPMSRTPLMDRIAKQKPPEPKRPPWLDRIKAKEMTEAENRYAWGDR